MIHSNHQALRLGLADKLRNIIEEFPDSSTDPTVLKHDDNLTCLHEAVHRQQFQCVKVLVEVAHVDVNAKTLFGLTPLHLAAKHGKEVVTKLDECVTDNQSDGVVATEGDDPMIAYLIQHGAKCTDYEEMTPLLMAVKNQHRSHGGVLLDSDAEYMRRIKRITIVKSTN
ncbi:hypothetical protein FBUS_07613 [Fasciolopsis buskii]|uniref:Uncharacterized protein n=1 Tax=Fasciolopsis buskii TaxID=27845 RepID=A0A8E0VKL4_9TREM|nr:hypothetical protein FBUS_07613 [Fasciolopsis buski]